MLRSPDVAKRIHMFNGEQIVVLDHYPNIGLCCHYRTNHIDKYYCCDLLNIEENLMVSYMSCSAKCSECILRDFKKMLLVRQHHVWYA